MTSDISDAMIEKAAVPIEGDVEYVAYKRNGQPLAMGHVHLTHDEATAVARAVITAVADDIREQALEDAAERFAAIKITRAVSEQADMRVHDYWRGYRTARDECVETLNALRARAEVPEIFPGTHAALDGLTIRPASEETT